MLRSHSLISTIPLFLWAFPLLAQDAPPHFSSLDEIICKEKAAADVHHHTGSSRSPLSETTDIIYQRMYWEIDPSLFYIRGHITYHFTALTDALTSISLDLSPELQINSITRQLQPLTYTHGDDQILTIDLGHTLAPGETDSLTIDYEGIPPSNGFGSFSQATHAGAPIIWTLSEPYGVRDWWPGKQDLIDKVDSVDIFISTPLGQLAASNGKLMSIDTINDRLVHHWQHRHPITSYLIALAVTNYVPYSHFLPLDNGDSLEILNYVYPESLVQAQASTPRTLDFMTIFSDLFGPYPFANEKYGHAQFSWGGGMEHQTMSFMGNFGYELQAHELAHQWFGNKVTCGSWSDIWLNEGFATYMTGLTYEHLSPDLYWPLWKNSVSNFVTSESGGTVFVDDTTSVNRIFSSRLSYNKGAYVLHMLRWILGDDAFFQACRDYLDAEDTSYGFGRTDDLQAHMEARHGENLDYYFADWYYGQGYPSYDLSYQTYQDSAILYLHQRQSHASVPFFELPVPIEISLDGIRTKFRLNHQQQDQRFAIYIGDARIDSILIDPDTWLLTRGNTVTSLTTSAGSPTAQDTYTIYPSPAGQMVRIDPADGVKSVDIINSASLIQRRRPNDGTIDLQDFTPGRYTLRIWSSDETLLAVRPLVIIR